MQLNDLLNLDYRDSTPITADDLNRLKLLAASGSTDEAARQLATWISTKMYGKDVRRSLAAWTLLTQQVMDVLVSQTHDSNNLIKNNQFIGTLEPMFSIGGADLTIVNRDGQRWVRVSGPDDGRSYKGVFWRFDSSTQEFSNFSKTTKHLEFEIISDNSTSYVIQTKTFDEDGAAIIEDVYRFHLGAGAYQHIEADIEFKPHDNSTVFELIICQDNPSKTSFNIRDAMLNVRAETLTNRDDYLIKPKSTPLKGTVETDITKIMLSNKTVYSVKNSTDPTKGAGIVWRNSVLPIYQLSEQPFRLAGNLMSRQAVSGKIIIMWQLLDANMGVVAQNNIDELSPIPYKKTNLDMYFSVQSHPDARFFQVLIKADDNADFVVFPDLNVKFCYPNYEVKDYANGDWITNFYGNNTVPFLIRYYGKTWVKVLSTKLADWQGVAFPVNLSRGIYTPRFNIDFDIMSDNPNNYVCNVHYMAADNSTVLGQDVISNFTLLGGEFKHFNFEYKFRQVIGAQYAKVLIYQDGKATTPSFMVSDFHIAQKSKEDRGTKNSTNLPRINIVGDLTGMDKETKKKVVVEISYDNKMRSEYATCKWQGDSSTMYPKKSYRLIFYKDGSYEKKKKILIIPDYEPTNSINVKANFIDWTQANNLLISNYVSQLTIANGDELDREQLLAPNQSQIVGYPCTVELNGEFNGAYTISNKSEDYMNNMDDANATHWLISGAVWSDTVTFNTDSATFDPTKDFEVLTPDPEVTPTPEQLKSSFNELLKLTNSGTDDEFASKISAKVNLQSVANWVVMLTMFRLTDDAGKNIRWQTRDGVKWSALMYDHDLAYGADFMANDWFEADNWELKNIADRHKLIKRLLANGLLQSYLKTAYAEAVNLFPATKVIGDYRRYMTLVGGNNYELDLAKWPVVGQNKRGIDYFDSKMLFTFIIQRFNLASQWFSDEYLKTLIQH